MINQNLLYGVLVLILAYMRINPAKNILCYVILFLIALVILFPVEGWTVSTSPSTDDNKISNFRLFITDKTSGSSSSTPLNLSELPAKFYTDDDKIDNSKIKIELEFDYKFSTSQIEKLNAITSAKFPELTDDTNLKSYNNLLNMLMNSDSNLSGEGFQIKIAEMDETVEPATENKVVINHVFDDSNLKIKGKSNTNITKSDIVGTSSTGTAQKVTFSLDLTEIYNSMKFTNDKKYSIFYNSQGAACLEGCTLPPSVGSTYQCEQQEAQTESCDLNAFGEGIAAHNTQADCSLAGGDYTPGNNTCVNESGISNITCPSDPSDAGDCVVSDTIFPQTEIQITTIEQHAAPTGDEHTLYYIIKTEQSHGISRQNSGKILIGNLDAGASADAVTLPPGLYDLHHNLAFNYGDDALLLDDNASGNLANAVAGKQSITVHAAGETGARFTVTNSVIKTNEGICVFTSTGTCASPCESTVGGDGRSACEGHMTNPSGGERVSICSYTPQQDAGICLPDSAYYDTKLCTKTEGTDNKYAYYDHDSSLSYGTCGSNSFKSVDATSFTKWGEDIEIRKNVDGPDGSESSEEAGDSSSAPAGASSSTPSTDAEGGLSVLGVEFSESELIAGGVFIALLFIGIVWRVMSGGDKIPSSDRKVQEVESSIQ